MTTISVPRSEYELLTESVRELAAEIARVELPALVKNELLKHTRDLQEVLANYQLHGMEGIAKSANAIAIAILTYEKPLKGSEGVISKAATVMNRVQDLVIKSATIYQIAAPIIRKLLGAG